MAAMAPLVRFGLVSAGVGLFLWRIKPLVADVQLTYGERIVAAIVALVILGTASLAAWVFGRLLRAAAELIEVQVDGAEAAARTADLIQWHVAPALERLAVALERGPANTNAPANAASDRGLALAIAGVRQAIADGRWGQAQKLIDAIGRDFPQAPEARDLDDELAEARQATIDALRARLDASKSANDPEAVIALRDELTRHVKGEPLRALDRELVRWLMNLIQRRMRTGSVRPDVAHLAAKVAESFGDQPEGASLRASLPTLRRSAGLCPRCAEPYGGIEDACPKCLHGADNGSAWADDDDDDVEDEEDELS